MRSPSSFPGPENSTATPKIQQRKPEHVRELLGTMKSERADIGVLILDVEPTEKMEEAAAKAKVLHYQQRPDMPPKEYDRIQILTAYEIIEGAKFDWPADHASRQEVSRSATGDAGVTDTKDNAETVRNPRYKGAKPEDVGRALLRHSELAPKQKAEKDEDQEADAA